VQILKSPRASPEMSDKARDLIERQIDNMLHLVTDLLDAARIARGLIQLRARPLDLRGVVKREVDVARSAAEARNQDFTVSVPTEPVIVNGDATRLEQALGNVLGNAIKYTPPGGHISLTLEAARKTGDPSGGGEAVLTVRDDGAGIAAQLLPRIFDLFMQADRSLAHAQGGLGIGLSLVRTLIELHGGSVNADSKGINQGSEFILHLPLVSPVQSDAPSDESVTTARQYAARRILVVDDNPDVAESSATMLSLAGHDVKKALSGRKALEVAKEFQPAVILLDIGMPDLDGYEVARLLRETPELRFTCLIAVSGYDTPADRQRAVHAGFDHHVVKPVTIEALQTLFQEAAP
jgi:two-component system CheB/CheR fusion protein